MNIINRNDMVEKLNEYAFNNNIQPVIECLNVLLENKQQYQTNLDLIFIAIASTQMYGFLSYLTDDEQQLFFECDYFRSNSYRGIEIPFYNRGQLSFLYELNDNQKVFFSAPTSFGKTSIVTEYAQKEELKMQQFEIEKMGLSKSDLNISLNVSNNWKIILYKHFTKLSCEQIEEIYKRITDIFEQKEGECINALDYIFKDLRDAFINAQINVFPQEPYEISPFDKSGDFTWGRLYQIYVSGSPKKIISNNINFISYKFSQITGNNHYSNKREVESLFESNNAKWILRYYNNDLSLNMNAFYAETFKIVSNIIQYKIPFYLTFYVSIFKLFMKKRSTNKISGSDFDINRLINIFEDGETSEEYSKLLDYGIPITTITKISNNKISIENLKKRNYDSKIFDEYEKIIIEETINLL